jgi:hypothetical protein
MVTLKVMLKSLEETHKHLQKYSLPVLNSRGINKLPDEILSNIFELACDPVGKDHFILSKVSRRFRRVAEGHAALWTYIPSYSNHSWRNNQILRSGSCGLTVSTWTCHSIPGDPDVNNCNCVRTFAQVFGCRDRWKRLNISECRIFSHATRNPERSIVPELGGLSLPRLEDLEVRFPRVDKLIHSDGAIKEVPEIVSSKMATWGMPQLKKLTLPIFARELLNTNSSPANIQFLISDRGESHGWKTLMQPAVKDVQEITFRVEVPPPFRSEGPLGICLADPRTIPRKDWSTKVELLSLRKLTFDSPVWHWIRGTYVIDAPSLNTINVRLSLEYRSHIRSVRQSYIGYHIVMYLHDLHLLARRSPKLDRIEFEISNMECVNKEELDEAKAQIREELEAKYGDWHEDSNLEGTSYFRYTLTRRTPSPSLK